MLIECCSEDFDLDFMPKIAVSMVVQAANVGLDLDSLRRRVDSVLGSLYTEEREQTTNLYALIDKLYYDSNPN